MFGGTTRLANGSTKAYVKVGKAQKQETFPAGTDDMTIQQWLLDTRKTLLATKAVKGTLASDIEAFLAPLTGRRKTDFEIWLRRWKQAFGTLSRGAITSPMMAAQFALWEKEGYSESSLNHLRTAIISLWKSCDGVFHKCPVRELPRRKEHNVRTGFFEHDDFIKVRDRLTGAHRDLAEFIYHAGWRHAEARELAWSEVDLAGRVIRLSPERSKTKEGRLLPIQGVIAEVIARRLEARVEGLDYVFHYQRRAQTRGRLVPSAPQPIKDWRKRWAAACTAAGVSGKLIHDFRRTVVRNLTRAGAPEKVAMSWTGHKTRAVFDRYNIVNERDLRNAGEQLAAHLAAKEPR